MKLKRILFMALMALVVQAASAYDFMAGDIAYYKNSDGKSVTVTYQNSSNPRYSSLSGAINIPESVTYSGKTYSVTAIGYGAFYGCIGLTSVTIPGSVTYIGESAFNNCSCLTSVTIPNSVTKISSYAFRGCSSLTSIKVESGNSVYDSRENCNAIIETATNTLISGCKNTIIPNSVTTIGGEAFYGCSGLTSVTIPGSVTSIGYDAFYGCTGLTSVTIPNSVTSIGEEAFYNCTGLTSVTIPNSVTSIGYAAFSGCKGLTSVTIPNSVTKIDDKAFDRCSGLTIVNISDIAKWCAIDFGDYYANPLSYAHHLYLNGSKVAYLIIPNSVTKIGTYAFYNCTGLTSITIPNSVTSIGQSAFYGCSGLTSVTIPNSVTSIGEAAFRGCKGLTSVTIPNSVTKISSYAFCDCSGLTSVKVEAGNTIYDSRDKCNAIIETASNTLIAGCKNTTIPNSITKIDDNAFRGCTLRSVTIPNSVTSIGQWAFWGCSGLTSVTIPNSVTSIGSCAFSGCSGLTSVTIGNSVTSIGYYAFYKCSGLKNIYSKIEKPANVTMGSDVFYSVPKTTCNLWVPEGTVQKYQAADQWKDFSNIYSKGVSSISLDINELQLLTSQSHTLNITVLPTDADNRTVNWQSSNTSVATVNQNGLVTAKAPGTATITATTTDGTNLSASCDVTVNQPVTKVSLNKTSASIYAGSTVIITATVSPSNATNKTLTWKSSNTSVATVDPNGLVTANKVGSATITATATDGSDVSASCDVTVTGITDITLNKSAASIYVGATEALSATITPSDVINKTLTWKSSNTTVATVDQNGKITAKAVGTATITATATDGSGVNGSCEVTVTKPVTKVSLNKTSASIYAGSTVTITATVSPSNATNKTLTWKSSNTSVATVDPNGLVTANKIGMATITASTTDGTNLSASCEVTVTGITDITLNKSATSLLVGQSETLTTTITPSNVINKALTWKSSNTSVATVDQNGKIAANKIGTATITATTTDGTNLSASCEVTVRPDYEFAIAPNVAHVRGSENLIYELSVSLDNRNEISGAQFIINLPSNVSPVKDSYGDYDVWLDDARKARNHSVSVESRSGNKYFVLISSPTNKTFKGNTGDILHMNIEIGNQYHSGTGDYAISVSDIVLAEPDETQHSASAASSTVRLCYLVGDANADVEVDVADYVATANYILGRSTGSRFFTDAANAYYTGNTAINVTDLVAITNIGLELRDKEYKPSVGSDFAMAPAIAVPGADYALSAEVVEKSPGKTVVAIDIDNDEPLAALQFDVKLPRGVTLENAAATERTESLQTACGYADGMARVLLSSFGTAEIAAGAGRVLTLTLSGNASHSEPMEISGVTMTERSLTEHSAQSDLLIDLTEVSGIGEVAYDHVRIYAENGSLVIESPVSGMAQIARINGISQNVPVAAGRNVYPVSAGYGEIIIATFNGTTKKIRF